MRAIFGIVLVFSSFGLYSQQSAISEGYAGQRDISNGIGNGVWIKNNENANDIKGSQYLFDSWYYNAKLYADNNNRVYNLISFNVKNQRFEAKFAEDSVMIINTSNISKIINRDKTFNRFELEDNTSNPFFEVIGNFDNSILLKKYNLVIKEGSFNPMTQKMIRPSEYIIKEAYFAANLDGTNVKETKLNKSTIVKLFDKSKQERVQIFAQENHLNFKDELDVQRIFKYTCTL